MDEILSEEQKFTTLGEFVYIGTKKQDVSIIRAICLKHKIENDA